ncbi:MAG: BMP family ABC transporter substrate-binding protein [Ruminococcus sp.]|nr:BMP family ABC transporter substrate-binding protein [Ruminococcus sp.]
MREDYKAAKKLGDDAVKEANKKGIPPYLPILDENPAVKEAVSEIKLGLIELPLDRIVGNKETGRNSAFANNFMPLLEEGTEFAVKWSNLYDSFMQEGIRDAIKVYEFMNDYYVQEGNKRVSVARYGDMEFILADVRRIIPKPDDSKEYKLYAEYMEFYDSTKNPYIVFGSAGAYKRLAKLLGEELGSEWGYNTTSDLKSAFFKFCRYCRSTLKMTDPRELSDAFLMYISIFPIKTIMRDSEEQIVKNIKMASAELLTDKSISETLLLESVPEEAPSSGQFSLINRLWPSTKGYSANAPLKVGFIYDADIDDSRWIDSHEAGRLYVDEVTGSNVVTKAYQCGENTTLNTIEAAVNDGCKVVFTVSPSMMDDSVKAAIKFTGVKILNCSFGNTAATVRCYYGKLYEAAFLMGILAADRLLIEYGSSKDRRIGYLSRTHDSTSVRILNAFAIGVSLIDPECRISLKCDRPNAPEYFRREWDQEGVKMFADFDYSNSQNVLGRAGLFMIKDGKDVRLGKPYFNWGKYYVQIVQSVLSGLWDINEKNKIQSAANYWFGLSTGVVDILVADLPYQTNKLLSFMKSAIVNGSIDPFSGELHSQDGNVIHQNNARSRRVSAEQEKMKTSDIAEMDWLNDNIDGGFTL